MAKAKDVLRRLVALADGGKLPDSKINAILNGMTVNGEHEYRDGHLKNLESGAVTTLSPDRIKTVEWPDASSDAHIKSD